MSQPTQPPKADTPHYQGAKSKAEKDRLARALRRNLLRRKAPAPPAKNPDP